MIAGLLRQVASLQLDADDGVASEVARELAFRTDEEQGLRAELAAINSEIANHTAAIRQRAAEVRQG